MTHSLRGEYVLVTGGTGFIGGRLVEKLVLECGAKVRVLVHNFSHAARIARFPVEMVQGEITDIEAVRRAASGCGVIFHCAYGSSGTAKQRRAVTVSGTESVAKAALFTGARMVHFSTVSVYGRAADGDLDETAPRKRSGDLYADAKLSAEQLVFKYHRKYGLSAVVIQPTIVYGPFGGFWTVGPISQLKSGYVVLINGGNGLCNAVYVDDVVNAALLAAVKDEAIGEAFLVSAENPVTWRDFYGAYENMLNTQATVSMSLDELRAYTKQQSKANSTLRQVQDMLRDPELRGRIAQLPVVAGPYRLLRAIVSEERWLRLMQRWFGANLPSGSLNSGERPIHIPDRTLVALFCARTRVRIDKARQVLGYQPCFDLERGMELTAKWAAWANLL